MGQGRVTDGSVVTVAAAATKSGWSVVEVAEGVVEEHT